MVSGRSDSRSVFLRVTRRESSPNLRCSQGLGPSLNRCRTSFTWEQRKLGELCEVNPTVVLPKSFEYVDLESVVGTDMVSHRREEKITAPSRAQRLASVGDIFYQTVRPYQKNNYFYELPDEDYVFSTGYAQLRPLCDGRFLFASLQREQFVSCVLEHCTGTSYPAINANDLTALSLAIPNNPEEQRLVGSILKPIDSLITLHQGESNRACGLIPRCPNSPSKRDSAPRNHDHGAENTQLNINYLNEHLVQHCLLDVPEQLELTLMKGDEGIEVGKVTPDLALLD